MALIADMKVPEQCGIAASKVNQILGLIGRNITYKENKLTILLNNARSHLEYCIQDCIQNVMKDIYTPEQIQGKATKVIPEQRDLSYEESLNESGLSIIETGC